MHTIYVLIILYEEKEKGEQMRPREALFKGCEFLLMGAAALTEISK